MYKIIYYKGKISSKKDNKSVEDEFEAGEDINCFTFQLKGAESPENFDLSDDVLEKRALNL